jgi:cysteine synthase
MSPTILDAVGNTPLVEIRRINPNPRVRVLAKMEYLNPGGSIKDRPALYMIEAAERSGELTPEKTVIEATSGNTGIGLALVCAVKGYRLLLAMSESVSIERRRILKARGAEILLTPGHLGTDGAIEEVYRLLRENPGRYVAVDQFNNEANWKAHYYGTGEEIWRQTAGAVTVLVASLGTTGTLMGVSRRLKEYNADVRIIGVEPYLGHKIQGLKNLKEAYCPEIFEKQRLDRKINIDDEEAYEMARRLAREEGLFVGMSSGAAMAAALQEAGRMAEGTLVVILPDGGERYLSTPLFAAEERVEVGLYNRLSRAREALEPVKAGKVSVYTCGPRLQGPLQLTEARRFVMADLLCRYLRWRGLAVKQVVDIMDLETCPGNSCPSIRWTGLCKIWLCCGCGRRITIPAAGTTWRTCWPWPGNSPRRELPTKSCVPCISTFPKPRPTAGFRASTSPRSRSAPRSTSRTMRRKTRGTSLCFGAAACRNSSAVPSSKVNGEMFGPPGICRRWRWPPSSWGRALTSTRAAMTWCFHTMKTRTPSPRPSSASRWPATGSSPNR